MAKTRTRYSKTDERPAAAAIRAKLRRADEMLAERKSETEIARALGVSVGTYRRWRRVAHAGGLAGRARVAADAATLGSADSDLPRLRSLVADLVQSQLDTAQYLVDKGEELLRLGHAQKRVADALLAVGDEFLIKAVELETKRQRRRR
jgi:hypothetical protein